jgi:predicted nucleotidyltransferase
MLNMDLWNEVPKKVRLACSQIERSRLFTREKITEIRRGMWNHLEAEKHFDLIIAGSLGRQEAHETSDVDAFVLLRKGKVTQRRLTTARRLVSELKATIESEGVQLRMASKGAFSDVCALEELVSNIGGKKDTNNTLTRRMVLLGEATGIGRSNNLNSIRRDLIKKYLQDLQPASDRRPIFLINDLVRYYRTMCVDYEYKKNEAGKPWAVRLMKLRHSRKLFYFSILVLLLKSEEIPPPERVKWIQDHFINFTPLERIIIGLAEHGRNKHWGILTCYNKFLEFMASPARRNKLDTIFFDKRDDSEEYIFLRDNSRELGDLFLDFILSVEKWQRTIKYYIVS